MGLIGYVRRLPIGKGGLIFVCLAFWDKPLSLLFPIVIVDAKPNKPAHLACKDKRKDEHRCTSFDDIGNAYCNAADCHNNEDSC